VILTYIYYKSCRFPGTNIKPRYLYELETFLGKSRMWVKSDVCFADIASKEEQIDDES
jgi:hypothetical protein